MMDLGYDLFVSAFTAILLSFIVAKLVTWSVCSGEVGGGKGLCGGVDNGEKQKGLCGGGVEGGRLEEKRLKVDGLKSKKKRVKDLSGETVLVSQFKGKTEPAVVAKNLGNLGKANDAVDDPEKLGSVEKGTQFVKVDVAYLGHDSSQTSSAAQLLSAEKVGEVESYGIPLDGSVEIEGRISSSEISFKEEVGRSIEGFDQETNSRHDLNKLIADDVRRDYREDDVVGEVMANQEEDVGVVGHVEEASLKETGNRGLNVVGLELVSTILVRERKEVAIVACEQDEGIEKSEPTKDGIVDVGLLGSENIDGNQDEHQRVSEPVETQRKDRSEGGLVDQVDDQHEEIRFSVSEDNVANENEEGRISYKDKGEMEISDGEEWEGIERNELERDFAKAVSFVECRDKEGQLNELGRDVFMRLHDLQNVAMEGSCLDSQPMSLNLSARAKWNAWRKSRSMNPEEAMEKYMTLLSDKVPGWIDGHPSVEGKRKSEEDAAYSLSDENLSTPLTLPLTCTDESKNGEEHVKGIGDLSGRSSSVNKDDE